jgi:1-phosphofructokinase/tagatose 6-phosphate kinase
MIVNFISGKKFLCVCLNPVIQKTLVFPAIDMGEVNRTASHRVDAAGKGICPTRVLTQTGEKAANFTHLGGPMRDWFLALCRDDGLSVEWVDSGSPIRYCTTLIEDIPEHRATELVEESMPVGENTSDLLLQRFGEVVSDFDAILLSGTVARGIRKGTMGSLAELSSATGKHLYLDLKGEDLLDCLRYRPVSVKPNLEELAHTMKIPYADVRSETAARALVEKAGRKYHEDYGTYLIVTRGARSTLYWDGKSLGEHPVDPVTVVNPIGSGDAFGAGVARMLEGGADLQSAVAEGTRLGGLNAGLLKPGTIM